ncbi:MAG: glycosyltransferase, partial [Brachybacterium sp.]|nr:glycosyltransferase [Brachybacterium sp.]
MRIAIVTETFLPSVDGVVTRLRHAVEHARSDGHEVLVIAPDLGVTEHHGARVLGMPLMTLPFYRQRPFALPTRRVLRALREFAPDVVHAAHPVLLASSGAFAARKLDLPLVASYHTHIPRYLDLYPAWRWSTPLIWWQARRNHALADVNLVTSEAMRTELAAQGIDRLQVLRRGVDARAFHPRFADASMRERLTGGRTERTLLVYVGRLAPEKQIRSLRPLLERRQDVALAVIGDGPDRERLE